MTEVEKIQKLPAKEQHVVLEDLEDVSEEVLFLVMQQHIQDRKLLLFLLKKYNNKSIHQLIMHVQKNVSLHLNQEKVSRVAFVILYDKNVQNVVAHL